ncbi:GtrA family protein [Microvirga aerophila]|uniref:GtrA family protein n=1 Tax=Microvirga aerophila TaxID=670291 RepID=UPI0035A225D3
MAKGRLGLLDGLLLLGGGAATIGQFLRYLAVGLGTNLFVLAIYYGASLGAGLPPKTSLAVASAIGFVVSFAANRFWAFRFTGDGPRAFLRYAASYVGSFGLQWLILYLGVDIFRLPHSWVVLFGLGCATAGVYVLQRYWVFPAKGSKGDGNVGLPEVPQRN